VELGTSIGCAELSVSFTILFPTHLSIPFSIPFLEAVCYCYASLRITALAVGATRRESNTMANPKYKDKDAGVVLSFGGQWISWTHTIIAYGTRDCRFRGGYRPY